MKTCKHLLCARYCLGHFNLYTNSRKQLLLLPSFSTREGNAQRSKITSSASPISWTRWVAKPGVELNLHFFILMVSISPTLCFKKKMMMKKKNLLKFPFKQMVLRSFLGTCQQWACLSPQRFCLALKVAIILVTEGALSVFYLHHHGLSRKR